jgi:hypothetical protein
VYPIGTNEKSYGFDPDALLDSVAIIISGIEFLSYDQLMAFSTRTKISSQTFYRCLPIIQLALERMWKKSVYELSRYIFETENLPEVAVAVDGSWQRRGLTSKLGNFAGTLVSKDENLNGKIIFTVTKMKERKAMNPKTGKEEIVFAGNHNASSQSMENKGFQEFLNWSKSITRDSISNIDNFSTFSSEEHSMFKLSSPEKKKKKKNYDSEEEAHTSDEEFL